LPELQRHNSRRARYSRREVTKSLKTSEMHMPGPDTVWEPASHKPFLTDGDIHIWRAPLDMSQAPRSLLAAWLAADESTRAARFHFQQDRDRFIAARGWLRMIAGRYLDMMPTAVDFAYSRYGKPAIRECVETVALRFNLAHAGDLALYAFTLRRDVGIDIEVIDPQFFSEAIARQFFSPREVTALLEFPVSERPHAFFDCWTRKEAFIKAQGMGLSLPLNQFEVSLEHDQPALLHTAWDPSEAGRWSLINIDPAPGYSAALAVRDGQYAVKYFHIDETFIITN